ncbi:liprin-beta-1-like [Haematobia irritans]|uniref:liprin-beta-1-like n=1 Tax=Haematobia irritans TaxID=7368 RepID=UPI003F506AA7
MILTQQQKMVEFKTKIADQNLTINELKRELQLFKDFMRAMRVSNPAMFTGMIVGLAAPTPDTVTAVIIANWLDPHIPRQDNDERIRRLQRDKESLALQYQMVADKLCEQSDRIIELEGLLAEKTQQLSAKDELLQRQLCTR